MDPQIPKILNILSKIENINQVSLSGNTIDFTHESVHFRIILEGAVFRIYAETEEGLVDEETVVTAAEIIGLVRRELI